MSQFDPIFGYILFCNAQIKSEKIQKSSLHVPGSANSCFSENEI